MTEEQIKEALTYAATGGSGALVWLVIEFVKKVAEPVRPLNRRQKFYLSMGASFLVPILVYLLMVILSYTVFSLVGILAAFGTGYAVSQTVHFETAPKTPTAPEPGAEIV